MKRSKHVSKVDYHPLAFGGWGDYQTWADHDYLPKPSDPQSDDGDGEPEPGESAAAASAVSPDSADSPDSEPLDLDEYLPGADQSTLTGEWAPGDGDDTQAVMARPYVRTGGRTRGAHELRLETLLSTVGGQAPQLGDPTRRALRELCRTPVSVAEIAARLGLPLGVARVLISDAITARHLHVHEPSVGRGDRPSMALLHRVAEGLRKLR